MSRFVLRLFLACSASPGLSQFGYNNPCAPGGGWIASNVMGGGGIFPYDYQNGHSGVGVGLSQAEISYDPPSYRYPYPSNFLGSTNPYQSPSLHYRGRQASENMNENANANVNTNSNSFRRTLHNPSNENLCNGNSNYNSNTNSFARFR